MACVSALIPEYLHWNGRIIYMDSDFLDEHIIYRLVPQSGNPIQFTSTVPAYSCNWSFLIEEEDVLRSQDPVTYEDYRYAKVEDIRNLRLQEEKTADNHVGWHVITCFLEHSPNDCNYSHCEVHIKHQIHEDQEGTNVLHEFEYRYDNWKGALLNGKSIWYKELKLKYKTLLMQTFHSPNT